MRKFVNALSENVSNEVSYRNEATLKQYGAAILNRLLGNEQIARRYYRNAISLNSKFILPYYELGQWSKLLALDPEFFPSNFALTHFGLVEQADFYFKKCIALDPEFAPIYLQRAVCRFSPCGTQEELLPDLNKAIELDPMLAQALYLRSQILSNKQDYAGALKDISQLIEILPDCSEAWLIRGNLLALLKKPDLAINNYSTSIELNPENWKAYQFRGYQYTERREHKKAIEDFKLAEKKFRPDPCSPFEYMYLDSALGDEYMLLGDKKKAHEFYLRSKAIPGGMNANKYEPQLQLKNLDPKRRRKYLAAINTRLNSANAYWDRAWIRKVMCDFNGAKNDAEAAASLMSDDYYKFVNRAFYRELALDWKNALADYKKCTKLKPSEFYNFQKCAEMCNELGDVKTAETLKIKAKELCLKNNTLSQILNDSRARKLFEYDGFARKYPHLSADNVLNNNFFIKNYPQSAVIQR
ncbi:MAG: tetratricopeptide repeat protein [Cyanobacteria bacterium TGS_CYA1]|nr:tetratricopeptide repeat protein [Cyanobacteria bacterium TGS_CYA1]